MIRSKGEAKLQKILLLPFLNIPSGHQQVAEAIASHLQRSNYNFYCKTVDIFSHSYGIYEKYATKIYLEWIRRHPKSYNRLYRQMVLKSLHEDKEKYFYERFFYKQMENLLIDFRPDLIICTHALPSRLINKLKKEKGLETPVFNIYTDFFIHKGWGLHHIDGHLVASTRMKNFLLSKGIRKERIFVTGIPVHPLLKKRPIIAEPPKFKANILISGGSMGCGKLFSLIQQILNNRSSMHHYFVLCGKNRNLYEKLRSYRFQHITPLPYIASRKMMDLVYNQVDLIVTKPGGVTVSECFVKRVPIMIYDKLPGQEEINCQELKEMNLTLESKRWELPKGLEEEIGDFFNSPNRFSQYYSSMYNYEKSMDPFSAIDIILSALT